MATYLVSLAAFGVRSSATVSVNHPPHERDQDGFATRSVATWRIVETMPVDEQHRTGDEEHESCLS